MEFKCGTVWQERARVHGIDSKEKAASSCYYSPFFFCVPVWSMPHSISHPLWTSLSQWGLAHHPSQCQILCLILAASSSGRSQPRSASLFYPPVHISWRGRIFINVLGHLGQYEGMNASEHSMELSRNGMCRGWDEGVCPQEDRLEEGLKKRSGDSQSCKRHFVAPKKERLRLLYIHFWP